MSIRPLVKLGKEREVAAPAPTEETLLLAMKSVFVKDVEALLANRVKALTTSTEENVLTAGRAVHDKLAADFAGQFKAATAEVATLRRELSVAHGKLSKSAEDRFGELDARLSAMQSEMAALRAFVADMQITVLMPPREKTIEYEAGFPVRTVEKDLSEPKPAKVAELFGRKSLDATEPEPEPDTTETTATPNGE